MTNYYSITYYYLSVQKYNHHKIQTSSVFMFSSTFASHIITTPNLTVFTDDMVVIPFWETTES